jgi:hypothetical protein
MTASMLLLTAGVLAGGDPAPAAPGCNDCGPAPAAGCCDAPGLLDRLKAKFARKGDCGCTPCGTPLLSKPVFAGFTTAAGDSCDPCAKPGLLSRLKAKFHKPDACGCPAPACDPCGPGTATAASPLPAVPVAPAMTAPAAPQVMPKPADPQKMEPAPKPADAPKKTTKAEPAPLPVVPVSTARPLPLGGGGNPF